MGRREQENRELSGTLSDTGEREGGGGGYLHTLAGYFFIFYSARASKIVHAMHQFVLMSPC